MNGRDRHTPNPIYPLLTSLLFQKSKGQLSSKQMDWLPLHSKENSNVCPTTEVLVLLTQG